MHKNCVIVAVVMGIILSIMGCFLAMLKSIIIDKNEHNKPEPNDNDDGDDNNDDDDNHIINLHCTFSK